MNIAGTEFDLNYNALSIFVSGCDGACEGCHNSQLWDFNIGRDSKDSNSNIRLGYKISEPIVKNIFLMGGEPLLNNNCDLEDFLKVLNLFNKPIMLWTRYELKDIPKNILQYCDYVKTGYYDCNSESYQEPLFGITLASTNQSIIKV